MILPYLARLACLSLACFFLVHLVLGLGMSWMASSVLARLKHLRASSAANLLLAARLFPSAGAVLVVVGICVPSYLWLEPEAPVEQVGLVCLAAALLSAVSWVISISRGLRAIVLSVRYERHCRRVGREARLVGEATPVMMIEGVPRLIALAGIFHPRLVVSHEVVRELSAEQLSVALRHERAHWSSRDNLKRLLLLLAPQVFPLRLWQLGGLRALEHGWTRFTEWAADDRAVDGVARRSISLAEALVRVARLGGSVQVSPLMTSLVTDAGDLEARVERLLRTDAGVAMAGRHRIPLVASMVLSVGLLVAVLTESWMLQMAHGLLEHLIR